MPKWFIIGAACILLVDQATKFLARTVVLNPHFSFSVWLPGPAVVWHGSFLLLLGIYTFTEKRLSPLHRGSLLFLLTAGFSNFLDRVLFGGVRDIWLLPFIGLRNNFSDYVVALCVGVFVSDTIRYVFFHSRSAGNT